MPIRLTDLIARVPPEVEKRVRHVRDQTRSVLQDALRGECRLLLRTPAETEANQPGAQVPVEVAPGHPAILKNISFPDDFGPVSVLTFDTFQQRREGQGEKLKLGKQKAEMGRGTVDH